MWGVPRWWVDVALVAVTGPAAGVQVVGQPWGVVARSPWWWVDAGCGVAATCLVLGHRRFPVTALLLVAGLGIAASGTTGPAGGVLVFAVGLRRPLRVAIPVGVAVTATGGLHYLVRLAPLGPMEGIRVVLITGSAVACLLAFGAVMRSRNELIDTLAEQSEVEHRLRLDGARRAERSRIAREMHDVLGHRISMLSMHSGSLTHRHSLRPEELRDGLETIRTNANAALRDMRAMLGVLRDPTAPPEPGEGLRPLPGLADLDTLVASMRQSGLALDVRSQVDSPHLMPPLCGRTLYRVAQEALTNATKHAPGAPVQLTIEAAPGAGALLEVDNPLPAPATTSAAPGARSGLIGIRERVELAGGQVLHCGPDPTHTPAMFRIEVKLSWPT